MRVCSFCVMDETDPLISFDSEGICNHCTAARRRLDEEVTSGLEGSNKLKTFAQAARSRKGRNEYDCVMGVSGGIDSSYVAMMLKDLGLRPLAVHLDNGWDSELAVGNIQRLLSTLDIDLHTTVVDWDEIRDLQRAYFHASVCNVEAVTDHAIFATLWREAARRGIQYVVSGSNLATESILPRSWSYDSRDLHNLRQIHKRFGSVRLRTFPAISATQFMFCVFIRGIRIVKPLNYVDYEKELVIDQLRRRVGYIPYSRKHGESVFTRFFQEVYLPEKFSIDKRKAHLSSLVVSGQLSRAAALQELGKPLLTQEERQIELEYVSKKLGFTAEEMQCFIATHPRTHEEYGSRHWMYSLGNPVTRWVRSAATRD